MQALNDDRPATCPHTHESGSVVMNVSLHVPGWLAGFHTLRLFHEHDTPSLVRHEPADTGSHLDLCACSPCDVYVEQTDPDVLACKLSLTFDAERHPRPRRGAFGYDFEPFM
jgi:hypothetical protein